MIVPLAEHPEFHEAVVQWLHSEWSVDASEIETFLPPSSDRPGALVATAGDQPIGALAFKRHQSRFQSSAELWINAVYVHPDHRRQGVGGQLVRAAMDVCRSQCVVQVFAFTDVPGLYSTCGWQRLFLSADSGMSTMVYETGCTPNSD